MQSYFSGYDLKMYPFELYPGPKIQPARPRASDYDNDHDDNDENDDVGDYQYAQWSNSNGVF